MTAFYGLAAWRLLWPNLTLEKIIEDTIKRFPRNLVKDRDNKRHQMVVETSTGEIVGYARWILPKDSNIKWLEGQVAEPSPEEKERFEASFQSMCEDGRPIGLNKERLEVIDVPLEAEEAVVKGDRRFLGKCRRGTDFFANAFY